MASTVDATAPTNARILRAATGLFYRFGYHGTTTRAIASEVGIQAGSLYNHFSSKEDILYEIALSTMEEALEGCRDASAEFEDPEAQLRALVGWHVRYHALNRLRTKVTDDEVNALSPPKRDKIVAMRDELDDLHRSIIKAGVRKSGWKATDASVTTFAIVTMCTTVGTWFREDGRLSADEVARLYADIAVAAVKYVDG